MQEISHHGQQKKETQRNSEEKAFQESLQKVKFITSNKCKDERV